MGVIKISSAMFENLAHFVCHYCPDVFHTPADGLNCTDQSDKSEQVVNNNQGYEVMLMKM